MTKSTLSRCTGLLCTLALLLTLTLAILPAMATPASAAEVTASGTCGDALTWELTDDGVLTISGTGDMSDYSSGTMPWFDYSSSVVSVVVGDGVTSIGTYAFYKFTGIVSVVFSDTLTVIDDYAFYGCSSLTSVEFPDSLLSIGYESFGSCGLTSVVIPESVTSLGTWCFSYNYSLRYVYFLSNTPPTGGRYTFYCGNSSVLAAIYVPNLDAYSDCWLTDYYSVLLYEHGETPYWPTAALSDYLDSYSQDDTALTKLFTYDCGLTSSAADKYHGHIVGGSAFSVKQLTRDTMVFDLTDLVDDSLALSITAAFTYTATSSSTKTYDGLTLYYYFYDESGLLLNGDDDCYVVDKGAFLSGTDVSRSVTYTGTFPEGTAFAQVYCYVSGTGISFTDVAMNLTFEIDYPPVPIPDVPELTDDFGGEVTYNRGASATPLSVTVTNAVNGTLSYQWYYIDSENVDVAVPISGATGTTYTPDTSRVGSRYYYCIVTNTLGELSESMCSDYAYITVERPALGDGYAIYDYKDYVTGAVVDGSNKAYTVTFPMSGIYTEVYGGFDSEYSLLDYFEGTNFLVDIPTDALAADNYDLRFAYYPLGTGSQYNVLKLSNVPYGIAASYVFWMDYQADSSHGDPVLTFLWYDSEMQLIGSTDYALTWDYDIELGYTTYSLDFDFNYPSGASYCAYSISVPAFSSEENMDFSARIVTADLVLTLSMMEDISGSVGEVGDKVDQVGDKIDDTNDKLDDILTGGEAGDELIQGSDKLDQSGEQLGGVVDDLQGAQDALPDMPDDIGDVLTNNTALVADSDVNGLMPWNDPDYGEFWNLLFTPTVAAVSVALLLYFVFGKARSAV